MSRERGQWAVSRERCGYVHEDSLLDGDGATCCWRPVQEGSDRCFWHAEGRKSTTNLHDQLPPLGTRIDGANLRGVTLSEVTWGRECGLVDADFTGATLRNVDFTGVDLRRATFRDADLRGCTFDRANVEDAVFLYADLRDVTFDRAKLHRTTFTDVRTNANTSFGERLVYEDVARRRTRTDARLTAVAAASTTYRTLKQLFEADGYPHRALTCYLREKDLQRRAAWIRGDYFRALKLEGARWTTRYGHGPWRVVFWSGFLMVFCAIIYPLVGGVQETQSQMTITYSVGDPAAITPHGLLIVFAKSLYFSVVTFATLGYGDIHPIGTWARALAGGEALLGSLLMALLLFVLTRSIR